MRVTKSRKARDVKWGKREPKTSSKVKAQERGREALNGKPKLKSKQEARNGETEAKRVTPESQARRFGGGYCCLREFHKACGTDGQNATRHLGIAIPKVGHGAGPVADRSQKLRPGRKSGLQRARGLPASTDAIKPVQTNYTTERAHMQRQAR